MGQMVRQLQVLLHLMVPLVMLMLWVLQVMALGVGPRGGSRWSVLDVGPRHSWHRVLRALLAGLSAGPADVCRLRCCVGSSPILRGGAPGDVDGKGSGGDATPYSVSGGADGEGTVGDVPGGGGTGDAEGEGAAVGATGDGAAAVANGEGVAGEAQDVGIAGGAHGAR